MEHPFLRNEMLWGPEAQARLARAHVLLLGLGGVGSYAAECLARSGVGELTLVDSDTIALTNLNRQLEALHSTLGQPKAEAVAAVCGTSIRMQSSILSTVSMTPLIGTASSRRAAGTITSWTPSIWCPASWIWQRLP